MRRSKATFFLDSPINIFLLLQIINHYKKINIVIILNKCDQKIDEFTDLISLVIPQSKKLVIEHVYIDYKAFWTNKYKSRILLNMFLAKPKLFLYFLLPRDIYCNWFTNPYGYFFKYVRDLVHVYHAPGDLFALINISLKSYYWITKLRLRNIVGKDKKFDLYFMGRLSSSNLRELGLKNYNFFEVNLSHINLNHLNYYYLKLFNELDNYRNNALLLLSGPSVNLNFQDLSKIHKDTLAFFITKNISMFDKYVKKYSLSPDCLWIREHYRGYGKIDSSMKAQYRAEFSKLGVKVKFISDFIPDNVQILPTEFILTKLHFKILIGEASGLLITGSNFVQDIIIDNSTFREVRGLNYMRNEEIYDYIQFTKCNYKYL